MVIKARPRIVSHGFETFVPVQKVESLHQRLVEMTNNDLNAWNFLRPVATPSNGWEENIDDFNSEDFAVSCSRPRLFRLERLTIYSFILNILDTTRIQLPFLSPNPTTGQRRHSIPLDTTATAIVITQSRALNQCIKGKQPG